MRRRRIAFLALTTVVFVASGWLGLRIKFRDPESASVSSNLTANTATSLPMPNSQISPTGRNSTVQKTLAMLGTPILFYGKVIDQNGSPIAEATVDYGTID